MNEQFGLNNRFIDKVKNLGAIWAKYISPKEIITAEWTRLKCQFGCFNYGRFTCPPHTPDALTMRRILDSYQVSMIFQFSGKWNPGSDDSQLDESAFSFYVHIEPTSVRVQGVAHDLSHSELQHFIRHDPCTFP